MIIPAADTRINDRIPYVTYALLIVNTLVFGLTGVLADEPFYERWGLTANRPGPIPFLTYQFLHAGVLHLVGNMLFLWFFGCNTERRLGAALYVVLYLTLGAIAGACFIALTDRTDVPLVGASGSIAGLMGLYVVLFPRRQIPVVYWIIVYGGTFRIAAGWFVLVYVGYQVWMAFLQLESDPVAYWAHIGGAAAGVAVFLPLTRLLSSGLHPITEAEAERDYDETYGEFDYVPRVAEVEPAVGAVPAAPREVETRLLRPDSPGAFALISRRFEPIGPEQAARWRALAPSGSRPPRPHCLLTTDDFAEAERLARTLGGEGLEPLIYPAREVLPDPVVLRVKDVQVGAATLVLVDEFDQVHTRGSGSFSILTAGRVGQTTMIDLVARKPISTMRWSGEDAAARQVAARIDAMVVGVPQTRSFQELARGGSPARRCFADEPGYHDYVLWAVQLLSTPIYRTRRTAPAAALATRERAS
jgi:membrane associated rhomboid family serine protease